MSQVTSLWKAQDFCFVFVGGGGLGGRTYAEVLLKDPAAAEGSEAELSKSPSPAVALQEGTKGLA